MNTERMPERRLLAYTCQRCGASFHRAHSNIRPAQFCSPACNVATQSEKQRAQRPLCAHGCGRRVPKASAKFCSKACLSQHRRSESTCRNGHLRTPDNIFTDSSGKYGCKTCRAIMLRRRRRRPEVKLHSQQYYQGTRQAENAASRGRAHRHGQQWTGPELELASRADLSHSDVAEVLGRTVLAVMTVRHRLKVEPKIIALAGSTKQTRGH